MRDHGSRTAGLRSTPQTAGIALLAILVLANAATVAAPIPVAGIVVNVALAVAGAFALVGCLTGRAWGRSVGGGVGAATALAAAPGVFGVPAGPLQYVAGATVVIGLACAGLLLISGSGPAPGAEA